VSDNAELLPRQRGLRSQLPRRRWAPRTSALLLHAESQTSAWHCSTLEVWAFHAEFPAGGLLFIWSRQNQWGQGQRVDSISLRFGQGRRQRRVGRVPGMAWVMNSGRNSFSPCEPCCPGVKARAFCL